jgi:hypothetical protein
VSERIILSDVPKKFLNRANWDALCAFAPRELVALVYINAPYPDEADPNDFFWDRPGSPADAISCYTTGRSLLQEFRSLSSAGKLIATGVDEGTGKRTAIPAGQWINLWPMFATNRAVGPNAAFDEVAVFRAATTDAPHAQLSAECIAWLKELDVAGLSAKKFVLYEDARRKFGDTLTHAIFDFAYLTVFGRRRGRPKKNV